MAVDPVFGIAEIDEPFVPFLPVGWTGLISGSTGTHLLAKQFARVGIGTMPVLYYTTYERVADVERAFQDFGWDASGMQVRNLAGEYYDEVLAHELAIARVRDRGIRLDEINGEGTTHVPPRTYDLPRRIIADLAALDSRFRFVLDSVDFLLDVCPAPEVVNLARQVRYRAQALGGQAFLVLRPEIHDKRTTGALEDLSDVVLHLSTETSTEGARLTVGIDKVRNHPERVRLVHLGVGPTGLTVAGVDGDVGATKSKPR